MRYADSGGVSAVERTKREQVRLQAAQLFGVDVPVPQIAVRLRVSTKSVYQWRRRWRAGGQAALISTGPGGTLCRLSPDQLVRLQAELDLGPAAHGWVEDQRWTLVRVATVIGRSRVSSRSTMRLPTHAIAAGSMVSLIAVMRRQSS